MMRAYVSLSLSLPPLLSLSLSARSIPTAQSFEGWWEKEEEEGEEEEEEEKDDQPELGTTYSKGG